MLSPLDLQNKKVVTKKRKYDKAEMDEYLELVFENYKELFNENQELQKQVKTLSDGIQYYHSIESTLQKALVLAEKTSKETKDAAILKAEAIEKDANSRASKILAQAEQSYEKTKEKCLYLIQQFNQYKMQLELVNSESFEVNSPEIEEDTAAPVPDIAAEPKTEPTVTASEPEQPPIGRDSAENEMDLVFDTGSETEQAAAQEIAQETAGGEESPAAETFDKTMVVPDLKPELERREASDEETLSILTADTIDLRDSIEAVKKEEQQIQEPVEARPKEVQDALVIEPIDARPAAPLEAELKEADIKNSKPEVLEPVKKKEKEAPTLDSLLQSINMGGKKKKKKGQQEDEDPFEFLGSVDDF